MSFSTIYFAKDTVTKIGDPKLMHIEVEKTLRAKKIGENCGLFYVPKVLEYDKVNGIVVFERIHEIAHLFNIFNKTTNYNSIIKQTGRSLAVIHKHLVLPDEMILELPEEFRLHGTEVFLHGDFNGMNICVIPGSSSIVILDWQMTSSHGGQSTYGSRYFDLIWFINYLIWKPTIRNLLNIPVNKVADLFIRSYFNEAKLSYDSEILTNYSRNFFEKKFPDRKQNYHGQNRFLIPYYNMMTKRFIKFLNSINIGKDFST